MEVARRQKLVGLVVSKSGAKTIQVVVNRMVKHPKYEKYLLRRTKLAVHDPKGDAAVGDQIEIAHCRPISKTKSWRLTKVIKRSVG